MMRIKKESFLFMRNFKGIVCGSLKYNKNKMQSDTCWIRFHYTKCNEMQSGSYILFKFSVYMLFFILHSRVCCYAMAMYNQTGFAEVI